MKIAITSNGPTLDSAVDERFGRAKYFLILDTDGGKIETHDNRINRDATQGAGLQASQRVADLGAEWVITGHLGPKAFSALKQAGVKAATGASGSCREALRKFEEEGLAEASGPDVQSHW